MQQMPPQPHLARAATYAAVGVASVLIIIKLIAWWLTGSVSILSTLIDSLLDAAASILNMFAVRTALIPADEDHRFGHGKAEALAGLGQSAFITGSGIFVLIEAGSHLLHPAPVAASGIGVVVILITLLLTSGLVAFQHHVIKHTQSLAIHADALHYKGDLFTNASVLLALWLASKPNFAWVDPAIGALIAGYLMLNAWKIFRRSLDSLMDKELSDDVRQQMLDLMLAHPQVRGVSYLRTRHAGPICFAECALLLDEQLTLQQAHVVAEQVKQSLQAQLPQFEPVVRTEPLGKD